MLKINFFLFRAAILPEPKSRKKRPGFTAARFIPFDKSPGVRPIAVGEVFRRIIGKAVARVLEWDVLDSTVPLQLCIGVPSACEAAIHAMDSLIRGTDVEAILLVDASNAFNALNRKAAMHNIRWCVLHLAGFLKTRIASLAAGLLLEVVRLPLKKVPAKETRSQWLLTLWQLCR